MNKFSYRPKNGGGKKQKKDGKRDLDGQKGKWAEMHQLQRGGRGSLGELHKRGIYAIPALLFDSGRKEGGVVGRRFGEGEATKKCGSEGRIDWPLWGGKVKKFQCLTKLGRVGVGDKRKKPSHNRIGKGEKEGGEKSNLERATVLTLQRKTDLALIGGTRDEKEKRKGKNTKGTMKDF